MDNAIGGSTTQLIKSDLDTYYHLSLAPTGAQEVALGTVRICRLLPEHLPGRPNYDQEWSIAHTWSSRS